MSQTMIEATKHTKRTVVVMMALAATAVLMVAATRAPANTGAEPFIGEITMFGGTFAPRGWAFCDGQLLPISENSALFSLLGTTYGGDGRTTFALPDLRGRVAIHAGNGPGLTPRTQGSKGGQETVTLNVMEMPVHSHTLNFAQDAASATSPDGAMPAVPAGDGIMLFGKMGESGAGMFHEATVGKTGGSQPHQNMQPYGTVRYIIALQGVYPSRS